MKQQPATPGAYLAALNADDLGWDYGLAVLIGDVDLAHVNAAAMRR